MILAWAKCGVKSEEKTNYSLFWTVAIFVITTLINVFCLFWVAQISAHLTNNVQFLLVSYDRWSLL